MGFDDDLTTFLTRIQFGVLELYPGLTDSQLNEALQPILQRHGPNGDTITTDVLINELLDELAKQIGPPAPRGPAKPFNVGG